MRPWRRAINAPIPDLIKSESRYGIPPKNPVTGIRPIYGKIPLRDSRNVTGQRRIFAPVITDRIQCEEIRHMTAKAHGDNNPPRQNKCPGRFFRIIPLGGFPPRGRTHPSGAGVKCAHERFAANKIPLRKIPEFLVSGFFRKIPGFRSRESRGFPGIHEKSRYGILAQMAGNPGTNSIFDLCHKKPDRA